MSSDVLSPDISIRRDIGCKTVANMIKGKSPEEIRKLFNIVNDFTPEEEVRPHKLSPLLCKSTHAFQPPTYRLKSGGRTSGPKIDELQRLITQGVFFRLSGSCFALVCSPANPLVFVTRGQAYIQRRLRCE